MKEQGLIFDIQRGSLTNGPGIRTTVFLKGCPLNCAWCHNPESKSPKVQVVPEKEQNRAEFSEELNRKTERNDLYLNEKYELRSLTGRDVSKAPVLSCLRESFSLIGKWMTIEEVITVALRDKKFYGEEGGLTLSGGEPFMQSGFTLALLKAAKAEKLHTCLDTSGYCSVTQLMQSLPLTDLYLFDLKLSDTYAHRKYTGKDNHRILENLRRIMANGAQLILRCPIIPGINDTESHIRAIVGIYNKNPDMLGIQLMPYENYWEGKYPQLSQGNSFRDIPPLGEAKLHQLIQKLESLNIPVMY